MSNLEQVLGFHWRGLWAIGQSYSVNDVVVYLGTFYEAVSANSNSVPSDLTAWANLENNTTIQDLLTSTSTGVQGDAGPDGNDGPDGSNGPDGNPGTNGTNGTNGTDGAVFNWRGTWASADGYKAYDISTYINAGHAYDFIAKNWVGNGLAEFIRGNDLIIHQSVLMNNVPGPFPGTTAPSIDGTIGTYLASTTTAGIPDGTTSAGFEFWINFDDNINWNGLFETQDISFDQYGAFVAQNNLNAFFLIISGSGSGPGISPIPASQWHHVLVHWNHSTNQAKIYIDGLFKGAIFQNNTGVSSAILHIGKDGGNTLKGSVSHFAVYTHTLNDATDATSTAARHYAAASSLASYRQAVLNDNPSLYYPLNGGTASSATPVIDTVNWDEIAQRN